MKKLLAIILSLVCYSTYAQFKEPIDPKMHLVPIEAWNNLPSGVQFSFIEPDYSLSKHHIPTQQTKKSWEAKVWAGETVSTQLIIYSKDADLNNTTLELSSTDLKSSKNTIAKHHIQFTPIAYVLSDDPSKLKSACGINIILDSTLVADRILNSSTIEFNAKETRPLWLSVHVPHDAKPGIYNGKVKVSIKSATHLEELSIPYSIHVSRHSLS